MEKLEKMDLMWTFREGEKLLKKLKEVFKILTLMYKNLF